MHDKLDTTIGPPPGRVLSNDDPFWPRIDLSILRTRLGLTRAVSDTRLEVAARAAVLLAASEFANWRRILRARGYRRLSELAGHEHGRALSTCYLRQVEAFIWRALSNDVLVSERRTRVSRGQIL